MNLDLQFIGKKPNHMLLHPAEHWGQLRGRWHVGWLDQRAQGTMINGSASWFLTGSTWSNGLCSHYGHWMVVGCSSAGTGSYSRSWIVTSSCSYKKLQYVHTLSHSCALTEVYTMNIGQDMPRPSLSWSILVRGYSKPSFLTSIDVSLIQQWDQPVRDSCSSTMTAAPWLQCWAKTWLLQMRHESCLSSIGCTMIIMNHQFRPPY